ncbi:MAG: hypothetical protein PWP37_1157 [Thermotogota bacterium]|nr:hypothetical protein [Thermotogota bacterium]MDK2864965.1 hypothetical protein [Thermotogota bacterium]HCZ07334.1 hypothetical protein [Thermotogota bacterium]
MFEKIKWLLILSLIAILMTSCASDKSLSTKKLSQPFELSYVNVNPTRKTGFEAFFPSAASIDGDNKIYVYSKTSHLLYESFVTGAPSVERPTLLRLPAVEYQHKFDEFVVSLDGKIIGYSKETKELAVFSRERKLISRIKRDFGSDILLAPGIMDQFWFVDKNKGKVYLMNIAGEIVLDLSKTVTFERTLTLNDLTDMSDVSKWKEVLYRNRILYVRTTANRILGFTHSGSQNPANSSLTVLLDVFPYGELLGFTVDIFGNLFIAYHSKNESKLKIALVMLPNKLKIFHEEPVSEIPRFFKILAYKGFLTVVEGDEKLKIAIYPIRQIKEEHEHH